MFFTEDILNQQTNLNITKTEDPSNNKNGRLEFVI